jgi:hypothetical protein
MQYVSIDQACSCCEHPVGAAEGCDLLILIFTRITEEQDQKIAAFGSSYGDLIWQAQKNGLRRPFFVCR